MAAFTLIEMLVVIAILEVLSSLLIPGVTRAKQKATQTACLAKTRSLSQASMLYAPENQGRYPMDGHAVDGISWTQRVAPYVGNRNLKEPFDFLNCPGWTGDRVDKWFDRHYAFNPLINSPAFGGHKVKREQRALTSFELRNPGELALIIGCNDLRVISPTHFNSNSESNLRRVFFPHPEKHRYGTIAYADVPRNPRSDFWWPYQMNNP